VSANTSSVFKNKLDEFWQDQEIIYIAYIFRLFHHKDSHIIKWRTNVLGMKLQDMQKQSRKLAQKRQTSECE